MKNRLNKYFNAELDEHAEKEVEEEFLSTDSAERDMLNAFSGFREQVSYPEPEKIANTNIKYLIAASLAFLIVSLLSISLISDQEKKITLEDWANKTVFEKVNYMIELEYKDADQSLVWELYKSEKNINVKIAMLRILDTSSLIPAELEIVIEEETSPIIKNTLVAMR